MSASMFTFRSENCLINHPYYHHEGIPITQIPFTLSRHPSLSVMALVECGQEQSLGIYCRCMKTDSR